VIRLVFENQDGLQQWAEDRLPEAKGAGGFGRCASIGMDLDGALIGVVVFHNYRKCDIEMSIATENPRWIQRGVLRALFHYPFVQLGCARVTAVCSVDSNRAIKLMSGIGFKQEGAHPKARIDGATSVSYGLLKEDCRWIA